MSLIDTKIENELVNNQIPYLKYYYVYRPVLKVICRCLFG